jgi:hypothetical protein
MLSHVNMGFERLELFDRLASVAPEVLLLARVLELAGTSNDVYQLRKRWPYDEIESLIITVLADGQIDNEEHKMLISFFAQFAEVLDDKSLSDTFILVDSTVKGVCANSPEIAFQGSRFCLTGASSRYTRDVFAEKIKALQEKLTKLSATIA